MDGRHVVATGGGWRPRGVESCWAARPCTTRAPPLTCSHSLRRSWCLIYGVSVARVGIQSVCIASMAIFPWLHCSVHPSPFKINSAPNESSIVASHVFFFLDSLMYFLFRFPDSNGVPKKNPFHNPLVLLLSMFSNMLLTGIKVLRKR